MYDKWRSYDICFLKYKARQTDFFINLGHTLPFYSPDDPENQNFEKIPGGVIILHMCILNYNHMMYGSWAMECEGQTFLSFWTIFCSFTNNPKNENFEKMKKTPGDIIILHKCTMNNNHMMHGSCDMKRDRQNFLSFWDIFCPFTWRYHHFT